jgi:predicted RNase H-like nuclease (RuvC/YqgF family)
MGNHFEEHKYTYTIPTDKIRRMGKRIEELKAEVERLRGEVSAVRRAYEEERAVATDAQREVERLNDIITRLNEDIDIKDVEVERLRAAIKKLLLTEPGSRQRWRAEMDLRAVLAKEEA